MTATDTPVNNGVNVEALLGARVALTEAPEAAQFQWRATCAWQNGTHSRSTVEGFFGLGEEQTHRTIYQFDADHPELFASEDNGATPVEYVLVALASCLTAGVAAVAQNREIQLHSVTATIEGGMDVRGAGYSHQLPAILPGLAEIDPSLHTASNSSSVLVSVRIHRLLSECSVKCAPCSGHCRSWNHIIHLDVQMVSTFPAGHFPHRWLNLASTLREARTGMPISACNARN